MPIYEYHCTKCGNRFELLRTISRSQEEACCPACQGKAERLVSRFSSVSKGKGGVTAPIGGSSCSGCSAASCGSCHP